MTHSQVYNRIFNKSFRNFAKQEMVSGKFVVTQSEFGKCRNYAMRVLSRYARMFKISE